MLRYSASSVIDASRRFRRFGPGPSTSLRFFQTNNVDDDDDDGDSNVETKTLVAGKPSQGLVAPAFGNLAPRTPHLLALPLVSRPIFPSLLASVTIKDPATVDALEHLWKKPSEAYMSCFLRAKDSQGVSEGGVLLPTPEVISDPSELYQTGTFVKIQNFTRGGAKHSAGVGEAEEDSLPATLILLAHRRVNLISVDNVGPPIDVHVKHWPQMDYTDTGENRDTILALSNEILSTIREVAHMNPLFQESLRMNATFFDPKNPFRLADFAASITTSGTPEDLQAVLEERDPKARLELALRLVGREREVAKLQREISQKVEEKMTEAQRKYFLTEQLKSIKKELGMERDDKDAIIGNFRKTLSEYPQVPKEALEVIEAEIEKFSSLEKNSPEYNVTRSYLDWLVGIPWGKVTKENFDIKEARIVLDRDHYGLDDVKDTILQFIAIGKLKGSVQGTGKTSIAKSVASALGRKFYRFSVGGLSDVSEIKGHRRTYIGAMPGKLIQCLKTTGTCNPVVLIDEIDKLGTGFRGDPASALLEVLDPSQNSSFRDHFLDVPVDISKVLFICTANDLDRIPGPLLDRMEVIRLSGYDFPEKVAIAKQYLIPKSLRESGLMIDPNESKQTDEANQQSEEAEEEVTDSNANDTQQAPDNMNSNSDHVRTPLENFVHAEGIPISLKITTEAVQSLVRWYAREAGVRNLAKYIDKITGKLALQVVAEDSGAELTDKSKRKTESWEITEESLSDYVGKPVFTSDRLYEEGPLPNGIVMGLAYTSMGGTALYIETQGIKRGNVGVKDKPDKPRGGTLKTTGQLGDVMQESSQIAYTVARARLAELEPGSHFFDETDIHMHVPEGATPKDGPSAGVTMTTSMLSLALGKACNNDVAMTGEISLTGKVLPVGGIKEKVMAARRAGISTIVLPSANQRDFDEIPEYLKENLNVHFAEDYGDVFKVAFSGE